jgi:oxygen-independent coproporphyrinogen-3 oxidase
MSLKNGLYIHIPFCRRKCDYCAFYSEETSSVPDSYLDALAREMEEKGGRDVDTVYVGGGTPSLLSSGQIMRLMEDVRRFFPGTRREATMEVNPEDITSHKLSCLKEAGFDRLSVGVQSFSEAKRNNLGRRSVPDLLERLQKARSAFDNLSVDLIFGVPGEDIDEEWEALRETDPDHISWYNLKVEPETPLGRRVLSGKDHEAGDDEQADVYADLVQKLDQRGYRRYEISNFARPGYESVHNLKYWHFTPYMGLGAAAAGFTGAAMTQNPSDITRYMKGEGISIRPLGRPERRSIEIMMGLRLEEGVRLTPEEESLLQINPGELSRFFRLRHRRLSIGPDHFFISNALILDVLERLGL